MDRSARLDPLELLRELVAVPGPPGREEPVRAALEGRLAALGWEAEADPRGNLLVPLEGRGGAPRVVVTAHLDEIALMVERIEPDGRLRVRPLGGLYPWKWGERTVEILTPAEPVPAALSFGSIHTRAPESVVRRAGEAPLRWDQARLITGLVPAELERRGVRPGCRVVLAPAHRGVTELGGGLLAGHFLDDRADLVAWLLALEELAGGPVPPGVVFAATASEEVGGLGALYLLQPWRPEVCIALEIGPRVPESPIPLDDQPTVWVDDGASAMQDRDRELVQGAATAAGLRPHWQALSGGASDASIAARDGLTARPITLGLPMDSTHGLEVMHRGAPANLARLLVELLRRIGP